MNYKTNIVYVDYPKVTILQKIYKQRAILEYYESKSHATNSGPFTNSAIR